MSAPKSKEGASKGPEPRGAGPSGSPRDPKPSFSYPRDAAIRVLTRVLSDRQPLDEALAAISGEVTPEGRGWLQEVCSGTLRWKGRLDQAIDSVATRKKPSGWLRKALLIAAYQLIVQERTSPGAVVSETVAQVKRKEGEAPAKFANALLRKLSEHGASWRELPLRAGAGAAEAASWASLPEWFWKRLVSQHGLDWAQAFARACLDRPSIWLRARRPEWRPEWTEPGPVAGSLQVKKAPAGGVAQWPGFAEGEFLVQDVSSQALVAGIAAEALKGAAERSALDLCAAPGGKSVGLAWSGFDVTATDRDASRMALLNQTIERAAPSVRIIAREKVAELPAQQLVWVDAPCSGTGIIRRHPDVRWLRTEKELEGLKKVQRELIREAWAKVRPGGWFAYSVCSVLKEEGPEALADAGIPGKPVREWLLCPQEAPHGDGFWCALYQYRA